MREDIKRAIANFRPNNNGNYRPRKRVEDVEIQTISNHPQPPAPRPRRNPRLSALAAAMALCALPPGK